MFAKHVIQARLGLFQARGACRPGRDEMGLQGMGVDTGSAILLSVASVTDFQVRKTEWFVELLFLWQAMAWGRPG
ncbi:MAG: hypothetical protein OXE44_03610 [Nitrospinae bacterium]|nr:hypothetical protein [Nitrospinota bacterium]